MSEVSKLFLIGNGFDLAHGMNTRYTDFLVYYVNKKIIEAKDLFHNEGKAFENLLLKINDPSKVKEFESFDELRKIGSRDGVIIVKEKTLLHAAFSNYQIDKWIDLEYLFYDLLVRGIEQEGIRRRRGVLYSRAKSLNNQIQELKNHLQKYIDHQVLPESSRTVLQNGIKAEVPSAYESKLFFDFQELLKTYMPTCFLNFNYTSTAQFYFNDQLDRKGIYIPIHGQIDDIASMVFGYGDDVTEEYRRIENININELLVNFKSFAYSKNTDYSKLFAWTNRNKFVVEIIGHSCGLSDRILLKQIFESENCQGIHVHYYQDLDNYLQTAFEISRHFESNIRFRQMLKSFEESNPCPQITD